MGLRLYVYGFYSRVWVGPNGRWMGPQTIEGVSKILNMVVVEVVVLVGVGGGGRPCGMWGGP